MVEKEAKNKSSHYFQSDGNGGFNVSKSITIGTVITILLLFAQAVYAFGVDSARLENLEKDMNTNVDDHAVLKDSLVEHGTDLAVIKEKIDDIDGNIEEIKDLLKDE